MSQLHDFWWQHLVLVVLLLLATNVVRAGEPPREQPRRWGDWPTGAIRAMALITTRCWGFYYGSERCVLTVPRALAAPVTRMLSFLSCSGQEDAQCPLHNCQIIALSS
jgi:hypothetical protein